MSEQIILAALDQAPALVIVAGILYLFLKMLEKTVDKLIKSQEEVIDILKANHKSMDGWQTHQETVAEKMEVATTKLTKVAQLLEFQCPPGRDKARQ